MRGKGRIAAIASKYFHLEGDVESVLRKIQNSDWKSSAPKSHSRMQKLPNKKTEDAFTQFWVPNSLCTLCKWRQRALHWAQEAIIFKRWLPSLLTALTMEERKAAFHILCWTNKRGERLISRHLSMGCATTTSHLVYMSSIVH